MRLAYLLTGIISSIVMLVGDVFMLVYGILGIFSDFVEWLTTSLDSGESADGYTFGILIILAVGVIAVFSVCECAVSIASFFLAKIPAFKTCIVLYIINFVLMFASVIMSIVCSVWQKKEIYFAATHNMGVWSIAGGVFWIAMSIIAILNIIDMNKKLIRNIDICKAIDKE